MKKIFESISSKKFYLFLFAGVIVASGITLMSKMDQKEKMDIVDLNGTESLDEEAMYNDDIVENDLFMASQGFSSDKLNEDLLGSDNKLNDTADIEDSDDASQLEIEDNEVNNVDKIVEDEVVDENSEDKLIEEQETEEVTNQGEEGIAAITEESSIEVVEVISNSTVSSTVPVESDIVVTKNELSFNKDEGIIMPVSGDVIMDFDLTNPIYFKTLNHYRTNSATYIASSVGTEVKSVYNGRIESIEDDDMYGTVLTINHGDSVESIYGQIEIYPSLNEGDYIMKGEVIGTVTEPTKYFTLEGTHLYFKMNESQSPINPKELIEK